MPDASRSAPDLFVPTRDGRIALRVSEGTGLPVLLLHGLHGSGADFLPLLASGLGRHHRLIAPDMPGHGASDDARDPDRRYTLPGFADAMVETLEHLGIDDAVVVGLAFGGQVGLEMLTCFPGLVGVMLWGAAPLGIGPGAIPAGVALRPWGADRGVVAPLLRSLRAGHHADQRAVVEASEVPIAVVCEPKPRGGEASDEASPHDANLWGGARLRVPGAGCAPLAAWPDLHHAVIQRFLADMERRRQDLADRPMLSFSW